MGYEFKFPDVGEGIHEGTIVKWHVAEGDSVEEDDTLVEMETAKAVVEIPSPRTGKILKRNGAEGATVKVGDVLVVISDEGSTETESQKTQKGTGGKVETAPAPQPKRPPGVVGILEEAKPSTGVNALPAVRRLAEKLGVDLSKVKGSGPGGRITKEDVEAGAGAPKEKAASAAPQPQMRAHGASAQRSEESGSASSELSEPTIKKTRKYDMFGYTDRQPFKGIRKAISDHMVKSVSTIPHVTHCDTCDVTDLVKLREKEKEKAAKNGIKLTYLPFIIKATILALQKFPSFNASLDETAGELILKKYYNIGIAVDTEHGLMVPVIKGADQKPILKLAAEITDLAAKAQDRKLDPMDMQGGTFTITNVGSLGGTSFTPIINFPESAILGIAKIAEEPAVHKGKIVPRHIMHLCVSFDHRIADGAEAARFLNTIREHLADPSLLLVEAC